MSKPSAWGHKVEKLEGKYTNNNMFARLGTDYEISNQCLFAILETMATGLDLP